MILPFNACSWLATPLVKLSLTCSAVVSSACSEDCRHSSDALSRCRWWANHHFQFTQWVGPLLLMYLHVCHDHLTGLRRVSILRCGESLLFCFGSPEDAGRRTWRPFRRAHGDARLCAGCTSWRSDADFAYSLCAIVPMPSNETRCRVWLTNRTIVDCSSPKTSKSSALFSLHFLFNFQETKPDLGATSC